jgi:hypothetical protein
MLKRLQFVYLIGLLLTILLNAKESLPQTAPPDGLRKHTPSLHAFTNGVIVPAPGKKIEHGTLLIREGVIISVGKGIKIPKDAQVWDLKGMRVYPGFIESYSTIGMPKVIKDNKEENNQLPITTHQLPVRGSSHWNPAVQSHVKGAELFKPDTIHSKKLRAMGFTSALAVPTKGIFKGTSVLVSLGDGNANELILKPEVAHHIAPISIGSDVVGNFWFQYKLPTTSLPFP